MIVERLIQQIRPGKWAELEEIDKKFSAIEARYGFPPKKRYQCIAGGYDSNTLIIEYQWESLAAVEAAYEKVSADPEYQRLGVEVWSIIKSNRRELYGLLP